MTISHKFTITTYKISNEIHYAKVKNDLNQANSDTL